MPDRMNSIFDDFFGEVKQKGVQDFYDDVDKLNQELEQTFNLKKPYGQDQLIQQLALFFQKTKYKNISTLLITGHKGTGRHTCLHYVISHHYHLYTIDCNKVSHDKLFIQDLYQALLQENSLIIFNNPLHLPLSSTKLLLEMIQSEKLSLESRYIQNKQQLIEANQILSQATIKEIPIKNAIFVFIEDEKQSKLGNLFLAAMDTICQSEPLNLESQTQILDDLIKSHFENFPFKVSFNKNAKDYLLSTIKDQGIHDLIISLNKLKDNLITFNLNHASSTILKIDYNHGLTVNQEALNIEKSKDDELNDVKNELQHLIGLNRVKQYFYSLEDLVKVNIRRQKEGLKTTDLSLHMIFTGHPGTGKTTVARIISRYLKALGILKNGHLVEVSRADLVASYVGQTAPKTKKVIEQSLGGVLFIDEAYSLYRGKDDHFGLEAIDTLVKYMEDWREDFIVILAGYEKEMETFLQSNSGLASRFSRTVLFPDYTPSELSKMTMMMIKDRDYVVENGFIEAITTYYEQLPNLNGNGRLARKLVETAILNQASRISKTPEEDLQLLKISDFIQKEEQL